MTGQKICCQIIFIVANMTKIVATWRTELNLSIVCCQPIETFDDRKLFVNK